MGIRVWLSAVVVMHTLPDMKWAASLLIVTSIAIQCIAADNPCDPTKLLKVRNVCGIVIDGQGKPIEGARLQLVSADGKNVTTAVASRDGQWFLKDAPKGKFLLSVWAQGHNSLKWPLEIQATPKEQKCSQPLKVHLAGALGWGCVDLVSRNKP